MENEKDNDTASVAPKEPEDIMTSASTREDASGTSIFEEGMGYEESEASAAETPSTKNVPASPARHTRARHAEEEQARAAQAPRVAPHQSGARVSRLSKAQGRKMQKVG